jgi:hypothetical protein
MLGECFWLLRLSNTAFAGGKTKCSWCKNHHTSAIWKKYASPIEKAIMVANIGFNPMNNGDLIIISVPH